MDLRHQIYYTSTMDPKYFLVLAVIVIMGWFAFGVIYNLRRGDAFLRWLQAGLPAIGERTTFRWLGTSVVELVVEHARKPLRRLDTLVVLSPRDVLWMWLLARAQGRRDTLIFRAQLPAIPANEFDLADPSSWTGRMALQRAAQNGWESQPHQGLHLAAPPGKLQQAYAMLEALAVPLERLAPHYWRFSLRRGTPHLEVHFALPDRRTPSPSLFKSLIELARTVSEYPSASQLSR